MRIPIPALMVCLGLCALSCSHAPDPTVASYPASIAPEVLKPGTATGHEALGVYTLERDPHNPLGASLTMPREGTAQGDLYELSVRPFMTSDSLRVVGVTIDGDFTEYDFEFQHPIPMPRDLDFPASVTKRVDLFLFDVQLVLAVSGTQTYFNNTVKVNTTTMPYAQGYRELTPLIDLASVGITDGTNVFPYQPLYTTNHFGTPAGNYDPQNGWVDSNLLTPAGYDVVPEGAAANATIRVPSALTGTLPLVVVAKYMDPRFGAIPEEKRQNRLPAPGEPWTCRYFLPEACGDLQTIGTSVQGAVAQDTSAPNAIIHTHILDWDNAATVAASFPDQAHPTYIRRESRPTRLVASFPELSVAQFQGTVGVSSGAINEYAEGTIAINNRDLRLPSPCADTLTGLIRIEDSQDDPQALDEALAPVDRPAGSHLDARYQIVTIPVEQALGVTDIGPLKGNPQHQITLSASVLHGPPTSWHWDFGDAAIPDTSTLPSPEVTLQHEGSFPCSLTISRGSYEVVAPFVITVALGAPTLPPVLANYSQPPLPRHYTDPTYPFGVIATSDNTPVDNPTTDAGATLGRVLFYDVRLSQNYSKSCASCHLQSHAFADPVAKSGGWNGAETKRNSMGLSDVRYYLGGHMFGDERAESLEQQVLMPIQDPIEMGNTLSAVTTRLGNTTFYPSLFTQAFGDPAITPDRVSRALAQFIRSMVSYQSKYDEAMAAGPDGTPDFPAVFDAQELRGLAIFQGFPGINAPNMQCNQCHATGAMTLGAAVDAPVKTEPGPFSVNNGLSVTYADPGTGNSEFKPASLRNVALTAPYMHDGRFTNLDQVVDFYAFQVANHPNLHRFLREGDSPTGPPEHFGLTPTDRDALVAFLSTLTDNAFITDPKFSDPFGTP